jgi:hypothetical protein
MLIYCEVCGTVGRTLVMLKGVPPRLSRSLVEAMYMAKRFASRHRGICTKSWRSIGALSDPLVLSHAK